MRAVLLSGSSPSRAAMRAREAAPRGAPRGRREGSRSILLAAPVEVAAEVGVEADSAESRQALVAVDNSAHLAAACSVVVQPEERRVVRSLVARQLAAPVDL